MSEEAPPSDGGSKRALQQKVDGEVLIADSGELWRTGTYHRKVFTLKDGKSWPEPSIYKDVPLTHLENLERIAFAPIYMESIGQRVDDGRELFGLKWRAAPSTDGEPEVWRTIWITRDQFADARRLLELAKEGFPVRTGTANSLSTYLDGCVAANRFRKSIRMSRKMGYHPAPDGSFGGWLRADDWVGSAEFAVRSDPTFRNKIKNGMTSKGDFVSWRDFYWNELQNLPALSWFFGASFGSFLMRWVNERNFFLHHLLEAHGGKTLIARAAQSIHADPMEHGTLNNTSEIGLVELFRHFSDFPLFLDETEGGKVNLKDLVYKIANGGGRTRSNRDGTLQEDLTKPGFLIIRTTGERPLVGEARDAMGGQQMRALEVTRPIFDTESAGREFYNRTKNFPHYGVAAPVFLEKLQKVVDNETGKKWLDDKFKQMTLDIEAVTKPKKSQALERQLAVIALGEELMLHWIFGVDPQEAKAAAFDHAIEMTGWLYKPVVSANLWEQAKDFLIEHRWSKAQDYVDGSEMSGQRKLEKLGSGPSGIVGIYNVGKRGEEIWYFPNQISTLLEKRLGVSSTDSIWRAFANKGLISCGSDRKTKMKQVGHVRQPMFVFDARALEQDASKDWHADDSFAYVADEDT